MAERLAAEIVVVGAGPAGLAAACCLGEAGRDVLIVDEAPSPGGQIWRHRRAADLPAGARQWLDRLAATEVRSITGAVVLDTTANGSLVAEKGEERLEIEGRKLVLATGARELFLPFRGWTLPGVIGVGAAQALIKEGVEVRGWRVILAGSGPLLLPVAALLRSKGAISVRSSADSARQSIAGSCYRFSDLLHRCRRRIHGQKCSLCVKSNDMCQRGFANTRWSMEEQAGESVSS